MNVQLVTRLISCFDSDGGGVGDGDGGSRRFFDRLVQHLFFDSAIPHIDFSPYVAIQYNVIFAS